MPPRKRERSHESSKDNGSEQFKTDQELFLQAFEKPTQIYRFLGSRQLHTPIFLQRNLTYMRQRMSRSHKNGKVFKVEDMLENHVHPQNHFRPSGNLTLTFTGYYDTSSKVSSDTVYIEASLLKICHKKRKEASSPIMKSLVGQCELPRNPDVSNPPAKVTAISIPSDSFNLSNGHLVKSYVLLLRATYATTKSRVNGICNGDISEIEEPALKKRKNTKNQSDEVRCYGAELVVYDKHQRCLLSDGEYQLALKECGQRNSPRKTLSWETFPEVHEKELGLFDVFSEGPLVTLHLSWNNNLINGSVDRPLPCVNPDDLRRNGLTNPAKHSLEKQKKMRIFYQFLYNNNTRQQTEARDDLYCPWCKVNCIQLYCLLKHLKLCHSRFIFNYVPHPKGARIDVSINESYDGSYVGNPHDLHCQAGFAFSRTGPVRRNPVTHLIVFRPKRPIPSLSEFLEHDEGDTECPRSYISGHNRSVKQSVRWVEEMFVASGKMAVLSQIIDYCIDCIEIAQDVIEFKKFKMVYYHTGTCHAVRPQEIDMDSESENDPNWLRIKTQHMIDEFTDVNEGEKELMKMWNLHVMKYGFVGDCQIPLACSMFIEEKGETIIRNHLYHNFMLHLCNLFDFGLISASVVYHTMRQLIQLHDNLKAKDPLLQRTS